jgi:SAM-dependent methyltransferase
MPAGLGRRPARGWRWEARRERRKRGRQLEGRAAVTATTGPGGWLRQGLRRWRRWPVVRELRFARLRRLRPLRNGGPNGTAVVRYYWARFLEHHAADIRGRALEMGTTSTIRRYGGDRLIEAEALDLAPHSPEVTVVADLSRADHVPGERYDCFVNQFTTAVVYDVEAALYHAIRLLKPGGVLLINFWSVDFYFHRGLDMGTGGCMYMHWWFTPMQVGDLLHRLALSEHDYTLEIYGNLLTRFAFLVNLPAEELTAAELDYADPGQPLLICARIVRPAGWEPARPAYRDPAWRPEGAPARISPTTRHYGDHYGP